MLFTDFSSAVNTLFPQGVGMKVRVLGLNTSLCNWVSDFLLDRPQTVHNGPNTSNIITLSISSTAGESAYREEVTRLADWCMVNNSS